jgi:hypothetical protein
MGSGPIEVLSRHLPEGTEECHAKPQSGSEPKTLRNTSSVTSKISRTLDALLNVDSYDEFPGILQALPGSCGHSEVCYVASVLILTHVLHACKSKQ